LPAEVVERLDRLFGQGAIRLVDVLFVSRDEFGMFEPRPHVGDLNVSSDPPGSTLWQLFDGDGIEARPLTGLELHSACEVGLDLTAIESLAYRIEPDTSALLILFEGRWATDLLDAITASGASPIVPACLEPETMLIVGPQLAIAAEAGDTAESIAAAHGGETLDALAATPESAATVVADVIRTLVGERIIETFEVDKTIVALVNAGLAPAFAGRPPTRDPCQPATDP